MPDGTSDMSEDAMLRPSIRAAVPEDMPELAEISRATWDGGDYLEAVAASWIAGGGMYSGIVAGRLFGCYKITVMPGRVAWLEGLRVHPSMRGRGLGRLLSEDCFRRARALRDEGAVDWVEFETYYHNSESIAIAESCGFERVEAFRLLCRASIPHEGAAPAVVVPLEERDLRPYPTRVPLGWKAILRAEDTAGAIAGLCEVREASGLRFMSRPGENTFTLCASALEDPVEAGRAAARAAHASGDDTVEIMLPGGAAAAESLLMSDGWSYWEEPGEPNAWVFRMR